MLLPTPFCTNRANQNYMVASIAANSFLSTFELAMIASSKIPYFEIAKESFKPRYSYRFPNIKHEVRGNIQFYRILSLAILLNTIIPHKKNGLNISLVSDRYMKIPKLGCLTTSFWGPVNFHISN